MQESNRCLTCGDEIPNGCLYCLSCIEESELECKATEWIRDQGWSEETLPTDEYVQMKDAYIAGAKKYKQKFDDTNKAYQELVNGWVIDYRELEKENEQLKAQIEKMKCCANCDYWFDMDSTCELHKKEISDFMVDCSCKDWECAYKEVEE